MRQVICLLILFVNSVGADPVETLNRMIWRRCNADLCFKIEAGQAVRSPIGKHYALRDVSVSVYKGLRKTKSLKAESGLMSVSGDNWFFKVDEKTSHSFDPETGEIF